MFGFGSRSSDESQEENRHSATSREQCKEMGKNNHWKLIRVEPTNDPILRVDCIFRGKQTSFAPEEEGDED